MTNGHVCVLTYMYGGDTDKPYKDMSKATGEEKALGFGLGIKVEILI